MKQKTVNRLTNIIEDEEGFPINIVSMKAEGATISVVYKKAGNQFKDKFTAILTVGRSGEVTSKCTHKMSRKDVVIEIRDIADRIDKAITFGNNQQTALVSTLSRLQQLAKNAEERKS